MAEFTLRGSADTMNTPAFEHDVLGHVADMARGGIDRALVEPLRVLLVRAEAGELEALALVALPKGGGHARCIVGEVTDTDRLLGALARLLHEAHALADAAGR